MSVQPKARTKGIISETVGDEVVLYDTASTTAHSLSAAAASVWTVCDGTLTVDEIAARAGVNREFAEATLVELERTNLLEPTPTLGRMSRRDFGRLATRAAIAAPIILSVAVPAAQAATSCTGADNTLTNANQCSATAGNTGSSSRNGGSTATCCSSGICYLTKSTGVYKCVPAGCAIYGASCTGNGSCCANAGAGTCAGSPKTCTQ